MVKEDKIWSSYVEPLAAVNHSANNLMFAKLPLELTCERQGLPLLEPWVRGHQAIEAAAY